MSADPGQRFTGAIWLFSVLVRSTEGPVVCAAPPTLPRNPLRR
jgi:hypothetical protein